MQPFITSACQSVINLYKTNCMKKIYLRLGAIVSLLFILQSCVKDSLETTYTFFTPVYQSKTTVLQSIKSTAPQSLKKTGKLFLFGHYLFVNELNKGVHIIDNSNPQSPKNISFINIPGNVDIAVKNNTLYADLFTDMIAIDITDPTNTNLKKVITKVFPERDYMSGYTVDSTKYIVDWVKHETTDKKAVEADKSLGPILWFSAQANTGTTGPGATGIGGSMARFTIVNNYLYTVGRSNLSSFNITTPESPVLENTRSMGWNIETIYPLKDKLFIGSQTGMFVYSIANPASPSFLSNFSHACFNDPVIADDQFAYVTLRATSTPSNCRGTIAEQRNQLDIVNISNIQQPSLIKIYDMKGPLGLSKDGDHLFICDGEAGLKIYNAANVMDLKLLKTIGNIKPFDIICLGGNAIVVAEEGIYQYDYSNINNVRMISKIPIDK